MDPLMQKPSHFLRICPRTNTSLAPDLVWLEGWYRPKRCVECLSLLPQWRNTRIDLWLSSREAVKGTFIGHPFGVEGTGIAKRYWQRIPEEERDGFMVGDVVVRGEIDERYVFVQAPDDRRVDPKGKLLRDRRNCSLCGRLYIDNRGPLYLTAKEVGTRRLWFDTVGFGPIIEQNLWNSLKDLVEGRVNADEIEVVD
jgi:hypothetical protein